MSGGKIAAGAGPEGGPWRRAVVVADLSRLHGPTAGVVELPHRLFWQPDRRVNLDNPAVLAWMYETVLREAVSGEELCAWLDQETLLRLWDDLFLPEACAPRGSSAIRTCVAGLRRDRQRRGSVPAPCCHDRPRRLP